MTGRWIATNVAGLFVLLCTGMFTAQAVAPAFVNTVAVRAIGAAHALYLSFNYIGGTLGAACTGAFLLALLADWLLCRA